MRALAGAVVAVVAVVLPSTGQERPLPPIAPFLQEVRARLQSDDERQAEYMLQGDPARVHARRRRAGDPREGVGVRELPGAAGSNSVGAGGIVDDGTPVALPVLDAQDRERREHVEAWLRKQGGSPSRPRRPWPGRGQARQDEAAVIEDGLRVYDFRMLDRETIDGHDTIAFAATPRPDARPRTREGKILTHFVGKARFSEADHELVRLEAEAIDTLSFGFGLLARVHQGSRASFQRRLVDGQTWLPLRAEYTASARVMLLRRLRVGGTSEFSDYRKFLVTTDAVMKSPQ